MKKKSRFFAITVCLLSMSLVLSAERPQRKPQERQARQVLDAKGLKGGLVVHIGCGDGKLTAALCANDSYIIHGLDTDVDNVETAREHIRSLGLYGKVSAQLFSGDRLPYADNLINLIVSEDLGNIPMDEVMRVLAPNGVAYIKRGKAWKKKVKPWPEEIDEWTHWLHDATGNAVAQDMLVDDAHVIARGGKYWLYYKGGHRTVKAADTKWGLAISDKPTCPFVRHQANPTIGGHTVCIWPHREGVAALIDKAGPESHSVQWSTDGIQFNRAAKLKLVHTGCGPYDPDAFTNTGYGHGITWGVAQNREKGTVCIVRFDVDLEVPKDASDVHSPQGGETSTASLPLDLTTIRSAPANASGLDNQQPTNWERHDPSNVIKYQGKYLLWVTEHARGNGFSDTRIILLSSSDGLDWKFEQIALDKNPSKGWDDGGVLTAYVVPYKDKFYLFYTGVNRAFANSGKDRRGIGYAVSSSPYGPWKRPSENQIIFAGEIGEWDELCADDANIIRRGDTWYLYYKGRKIDSSPGSSQVGLAVSDNVTGPYVRYEANPLFKGHAFTVTKHGDGLLALPGANNQRVLWSPDGIHFVAGAGLKHKSTGVCNPADFEADSKNGHIDWVINVIPDSPRKLHRINLIYGANNGSQEQQQSTDKPDN